MALEVVAVRRDGFDGEIELSMEDLPEGVSACGLKIPAGKSRGIMLITAAENAPRSLATARFFGRAADRRCAGESALSAGVDGLAGEGLGAGNSLPTSARRRAGVGRRFGKCAAQHRAERKQGLAGQGWRKAYHPSEHRVARRVRPAALRLRTFGAGFEEGEGD